jgi:hypothetical protein
MQAIVTKFICPTNHRGSRVKATASCGSLTLSWDHALNQDENHAAVAKAFCESKEWTGQMVGGCLPDGSWAWVFVSEYSPTFNVPKPPKA